MTLKAKFKNIFKNLSARWADENGVAAVEAAMVFPILATLLMGMYDLGNGILANQKTIRASQVIADLVTRDMTISASGIDEAVNAGQLALVPFQTDTFGVDIVSIRFDDDALPEIVWRDTRNMAEDPDVLNEVSPLAEENSGVVVVTVQYLFEPLFAGFIAEDIRMEEKAFARGRRSAVVNMN